MKLLVWILVLSQDVVKQAPVDDCEKWRTSPSDLFSAAKDAALPGVCGGASSFVWFLQVFKLLKGDL